MLNLAQVLISFDKTKHIFIMNLVILYASHFYICMIMCLATTYGYQGYNSSHLNQGWH